MDEYVLAFIMAGGRGSRLRILTKYRTKPAVSILGHYRIFDFVATNVANSSIESMIVAAQFEPRSLTEHIKNGETWGFSVLDKELSITHPHEKEGRIIRFEGTADSVRKSMRRIDERDPRIVLILGGDHIYSMSYDDVMRNHIVNNADCTIMASAIKEEEVSSFGIMKVDETGKIEDFIEKPEDKDKIEEFRLTQSIKNSLNIDKEYDFLASMGNYVFYKERLKKFLNFDGNDFADDIIPKIKKNGGTLYAYPYDGYWRDVGQVGDYFDCHMDFVLKSPPINLINHRVRTVMRYLPNPRVAKDAKVSGAILSNGTEIRSKSKVQNSIFGYQVIVDNCKIKNCIFLGADKNQYYQNQLKNKNNTFIGHDTEIKRAIIDKNVGIGSNVTLSPEFGTPEERRENLMSIGLKPYKEEKGKISGDFYIEPKRNILVIGKNVYPNKNKTIIPSGFKG